MVEANLQDGVLEVRTGSNEEITTIEGFQDDIHIVSDKQSGAIADVIWEAGITVRFPDLVQSE